MIQDKPIRVLVAKVGLDGHDRGAKVIATALRDAGMEVIYTGLRQSPEMVVQAALQEDVDAIGISILSGAHMTVFPKVYQLMQEKGLTNVLLTGGGIIPEEDNAALQAMGIGTLFSPGANTSDIATYIKNWVAAHQ
jgi:methylmalonyl-CoA mutase C-terminal domain/subunit